MKRIYRIHLEENITIADILNDLENELNDNFVPTGKYKIKKNPITVMIEITKGHKKRRH